MSGEAKNNPENNPQAPEKQTVPPKPNDEEQAVIEKFEEKKKESMKQVDDMFEKRISGSQLGEIALNEVRSLKEKEKERVSNTFETYKQKYQQQTEKNTAQRDVFAQQFLSEAENEADFRVKNVEAVLNLAVKGEYINENEAVVLKRTLLGMKENLEKDLKVQEILIKLEEHQDLTDQDYFKIITMVNPLDLTSKDAEPQQKFEVTTAGIMIGFMTPAQRFTFVEKFMVSYQSKQTGEFIDGLLRTGVLTVAQGEALFQEAVKMKAVDDKDFQNTYEKRLNQGFYVEEVKQFQQAMNQEVDRMKGMYGVNTFERFAGAPMLGMGMVLHSFFWLLTNVLASGGQWKNLGKNPYIWAALGEGALGVEITTGGMKRGTGTLGLGSGAVSGMLESKRAEESDVEKNAKRLIENIYTTYPDFKNYLENGGAFTIINLRQKKSAEGKTGKDLVISHDELLKAETDKNNQARLEKASQNFPKEIDVQINAVAEASVVLKFNDQADFDHELDRIKQEQGLKTGTKAPQIKS